MNINTNNPLHKQLITEFIITLHTITLDSSKKVNYELNEGNEEADKLIEATAALILKLEEILYKTENHLYDEVIPEIAVETDKPKFNRFTVIDDT